MENENKSYIEVAVKKLASDKKNLTTFILGIISAIFSVIYISGTRLNSIMLIYMLCTIAASVSVIIYTFDVDKKGKHTSDILIFGVFFNLLGVVLRTLQLGLLFSWKYYLLYLAFSLGIILFASKHIKNEGRESLIRVVFSAVIAYILFEIIRISTTTLYQSLIWSLFRIAEISLALSYILLLSINQNILDEFSEKLGKYKAQIPSLKICVAIILFISLIFGGIGAILNASNKSKNTVSKSTITQSSVKEAETPDEPKVNKAANTVSGGTDTAVKDSAEANGTVAPPSPASDIADIAIGQTVSTEKFDFTLNKVEFSYRVEPDNPPSWYTYYDAPENQVYIYVNAKVKNKQKQSVESDEVYSVTVDYDGGYTYRGFLIADDSDGDFTYANITSVEPLQTLGVHCLVACPEELETSEKPIVLTIALKDGSKYKYQMR